jgi:membrane associated rhomboid family serine protease
MLPLRDSVPGRTRPFVTVGLIVTNFLVWLWELGRPGVDVHVFRDGLYPCSVQRPCHLPPGFHALPWYEGVFSGMFMHASWAHILGNMLFLWIFGNNVEDALGHVGFLFWYLAAGIVAMAVQTFVTLHFAGVAAASIPNIGVVWFLGIWIVLQAVTGGLSLEHPQTGGGVAFFAHIGGFAFGLATGLLLVGGNREPRSAYLR